MRSFIWGEEERLATAHASSSRKNKQGGEREKKRKVPVDRRQIVQRDAKGRRRELTYRKEKRDEAPGPQYCYSGKGKKKIQNDRISNV